MPGINVRGAAPPKNSIKTEIVRVTSEAIRHFTLVSSAPFGTWIHWYGNRSHECTKDSKKCNGCDRAWPSKWKGYVHAIDWRDDGKECFVELTSNACNLLLNQMPDRATCRGAIVQISKTKGGAKGRYKITVLPRVIAEAELPKERDPVEVLRFLWACKNQHSQPSA